MSCYVGIRELSGRGGEETKGMVTSLPEPRRRASQVRKMCNVSKAEVSYHQPGAGARLKKLPKKRRMFQLPESFLHAAGHSCRGNREPQACIRQRREMSQRWPLVERGQLKRSEGGRTGGNSNLNSTGTNDWNKKEKLSRLPFFFFLLSIHRKSQGKKKPH